MGQQIIVKLLSFRFNENPFSSSWVVVCRQTDGQRTDRQTGIVKLIGTSLQLFVLYMPKVIWFWN